MYTPCRLTLLITVAFASDATAIAARPTLVPAQSTEPPSAVVVDGAGAETFVLVSGMVGGVSGFRRLEKFLVERGYRVIVIDPYLLSLDSADVTFAALARRVDAVLEANHVTSARVVAHSHGAGVMLRVAATFPRRVTSLFFLDAGAIPENHGPMLSGAMRLVPLITRLPGGRSFVRGRLVSELHRSTGRQEWLDTEAERRYSEPILDCIDRVIAMAARLARTHEPESLATVVARVHVPVTVLLGDAPHTAGAGTEEIDALAPLGALLHIEHLAGIGHFPHEEAPNDLLRYLLPATTLVLTHAATPGGAQ